MHTPALLDCLAAYEAPATFFLLGGHAQTHPGLVESIVAAGHHVGSHGWAHVDPWRTSRTTVLDGFVRTERLLEDLVGYPVHDVRPPYGHVTPALYQWSRAEQRRLVMWDLMPGDFVASARPEAVADRIVRHARPGSIVVLHEGPVVTAAALDLALPELRRRGWRFASL